MVLRLCTAQTARLGKRLCACRVPFDWRFSDAAAERKGMLSCSPASGHVPAGAKQVIQLRVRPGVPDVVHATALFEVAHFEPVAVTVTIEGEYSTVATSLPRLPEADWADVVQRAGASLQESGSRLLLASGKRVGSSTSRTGVRQLALTCTPASGAPVVLRLNETVRRCAAPPSSAQRGGARPHIELQQLDGTAIYGRPKPFLDTTATPTTLSQLEVEAEADRLRLCALLSVPPPAPPAPEVPEAAAAAEEPAEAPAVAADAQPVAEVAEVPTGEDVPAQTAPGSAQESDDGNVSMQSPDCATGEEEPSGSTGADKGSDPPAPDSGKVATPAAPAEALESPKAEVSAGDAPPDAEAAKTMAAKKALQSSKGTHGKSPATKPGAGKAGKSKAEGDTKRGDSSKEAAPQRKGPTKEAVLAKFSRIFAKYATPPAVYAAHYVCDFGHVIKGLAATKKIVVQNTSVQQAHLSVDRALLEAYGCTLTPEKLPRLAGAPDFASLELGLTLDSKLAHVFPGPLEFVLPLTLHAGPPVLITVRAAVSVPEVVPSATALDFGDVQWGMAKVLVMRLHNPKPVAAEWSIKKPSDAKECLNWHAFRCEPEAGVLAPGKSEDVQVFFVPDHPGKHPDEYPQELHLRVTNNPRPLVLSANGAGMLHRVRIMPKALDLGSVLPSAATTPPEPIASDFKLKNRNGAPIEVISLDFDKQFLEEEAMLAEWQGYSPELGYALLPPRPPGGPFWREISEPVAAARAAAAAVADGATEGTEQQQQADEGQGAAAIDSQPPEAAPSAADAQAGVGEIVPPVAATDAISTAPFFAIVTSFDEAAEAEQAARLAERYGVPVTTFTDLVLDAGELTTEPAASESRAEGGPTFGDFLYEELIGWEHALTAETEATPAKPYLEKSSEEVEPLVARAVAAALQQPAFASGCVVRGLRCEFAGPAVPARTLLERIGLEQTTVPAPPPADSDAPAPEDISLWCGNTRIWFVPLDISLETAEARRRATLTPEQLEATLAEEAAAAAMAEDPKAKKAATKKTPPKGKKGAADEPPPPVIPPGVNAELGAKFFEFAALRQSAAAALLPSEHADSAVTLRPVLLPEAVPTAEELHAAVTGVRFERAALQNVMPLVAADLERVAPPYLLQVVRKPPARKPRPDTERFQLMAVLPPAPQSKPATPAEGTKGGKGAKGKSAAGDPTVEIPSERLEPVSRWVLQPGEVAAARLLFQSGEASAADTTLGFEVYSGESKIEVPVKAVCAHPSLSTDPKSVFSRRIRGKSGKEAAAAVRRQYVTSRKRFEFGPLLVGVPPPAPSSGEDEAPVVPPAEHSAQLRLTNNGAFPLSAQLVMKSAQGAAAVPKTPPKSKGKAAAADAAPASATPFYVEPAQLHLAEGETAEVTVWCCPTEAGDVADSLVCIIQDNPVPVEFPLAAIGTIPAVDVRLVGDALAESSAAAAAEPAPATPTGKGKGGKAAAVPPPAVHSNPIFAEGVVFPRLLPGHKAQRTFTVANAALLPVAWALALPTDLPAEFSFHLVDDKGKLKRVETLSGQLAAFESVTVTAEFAAGALEGDEATARQKPVEAPVQLSVQDAKRAMPAAPDATVWLRGETYLVDVQLSFPAEGFDGLDFGTVRVRPAAPALPCCKSRVPNAAGRQQHTCQHCRCKRRPAAR